MRDLLFVLWLAAAASVDAMPVETGLASHYDGVGSGLTCAHRTRPLGTMVTVIYRSKSIQCLINDRGPFIAGRVIDLSTEAARALDIIEAGVVKVTLR